MKLTKENVCVFIEDEAQLEQAMELLVKYGEGDKIDIGTFYLSTNVYNNFLYYGMGTMDWGLGSERNNVITLTELEKILSDE